MKTKLITQHWLFAAIVIFTILACFIPRQSFASNSFVVEVCEKGNRFNPDLDNGVPEPSVDVGGDQLPGYGNEFITEGWLFPKGTLVAGEPCVDAGGNPLPEFLDLVIGSWTCYGWHVGDGAATETGPVVVTTQNFVFFLKDGDTTGNNMIVTNGFERQITDVGIPITRPIIGVSGRFKKVSGGESEQTLIEFFPLNEEDVDNFSDLLPGVKLSVKFSKKGRDLRRLRRLLQR